MEDSLQCWKYGTWDFNIVFFILNEIYIVPVFIERTRNSSSAIVQIYHKVEE